MVKGGLVNSHSESVSPPPSSNRQTAKEFIIQITDDSPDLQFKSDKQQFPLKRKWDKI